MMALAGRVALVTGGSSGIGRATAIALGGAGADLVVIGRDAPRLAEATEAARREGAPRVLEACLDLTDDRPVAELAAVVAEFGGLDILVHCAGIYRRGRIAEASIDDLDAQYRANFRAPYRLTQVLLPLLAERQGQVVFVNSTQSLEAKPTVGQFAATQHAMKAVADSLRGEVGEAGVRVLTVYAGRTATPRQQRIFASEGRDYLPERLLQATDVAAIVLAVVRLPQTVEVTDLSIRPMINWSPAAAVAPDPGG